MEPTTCNKTVASLAVAQGTEEIAAATSPTVCRHRHALHHVVDDIELVLRDGDAVLDGCGLQQRLDASKPLHQQLGHCVGATPLPQLVLVPKLLHVDGVMCKVCQNNESGLAAEMNDKHVTNR